MTDAGYSIRFDPSDSILHMRLWGFWSLATLTAYSAQLLMEVLRLRGRSYGVLSDSREFPIQGSVVAAGFERIARRGAELHRGRTAIVVSSHLGRIQAQRILAEAKVRVSVEIDDAIAWLKQDVEALA